MSNEEKILKLLAEMRTDITGINKQLDRMGGRLDSMDGRLDRLETTQTEQGKQLEELKATVDEIDQRSARTQILLETDFTRDIGLLFDGHKTILETLAPKDRVEELAEEVDTLKTVVRLLTHDVAELKKAQ